MGFQGSEEVVSVNRGISEQVFVVLVGSFFSSSVGVDCVFQDLSDCPFFGVAV